MKPEEEARVKIDKKLNDVGWDIVSRYEYVPGYCVAIKECLMKDKKESDYLLFVDNKAIAVVEAKKETNPLGDDVEKQAEGYAHTPEKWYDVWFDGMIPLVYLANGNKIYFKNLLDENSEYVEIKDMHTPKQMLKLIDKTSEYGALPRLIKKYNGRVLRDCQYDAEVKFEKTIKSGGKKALAILATGAGKTYLACLASYRLLNYTKAKRILFLADRNNLADQAQTEFSMFDATEKNQTLSMLYDIKRLRHNEDINGDIVISTIQKLFSVLTGQTLIDEDEDKEDEIIYNNEKDDGKEIELGDNIKLPKDYFDLIIVDECHRSIYGKWRKVLDYFNNAVVLGLTATPADETYAYFNKNIVENYTYENSLVDNVNVPFRVYRIKTNTTTFGGFVDIGSAIKEISKIDMKETKYNTGVRIDFDNKELDRTITDENQIRTVLENYRDAIYTDLYPDRKEMWEYIPKTLIFAKNDEHAKTIVRICEDVFKEKFENKKCPNGFVQRITYSAGDSKKLIRDLNNDKSFRMAVTVTLVATGTDVKPLEVVLFMSNVNSSILYTQMKGRGCRTIKEDKLKEVTPNAEYKDKFYIVDAIGVTESKKNAPVVHKGKDGEKKLSLENLLERLSHGEVSDDNLVLLMHYLSTINGRYENNVMYGKHLKEFIDDFGYSPKSLAENINKSLEEKLLPDYINISDKNVERKELIEKLIDNIKARNKLLELQKGYISYIDENKDSIIYKGFSLETAKPFIENFEKYVNTHIDEIEALRAMYNDDNLITNTMLSDLKEKLVIENKLFTPYNIWSNYRVLDNKNVEEINTKYNVNALTNYIPLCKYAMKKTYELNSLYGSFNQRYNLYLGMSQRTLHDGQEKVMSKIAQYILNDGYIDTNELNEIDTDLWRSGIKEFNNVDVLSNEMTTLSKFILKVA